MTKKHFKAIAEIIKQERESTPGESRYEQGCVDTANSIGRELASFCATMNPRFDRAKFLTACGIGE